MRARLEELTSQAAQHQAVVDQLNSKYIDATERLQSDKARLEVSAEERAEKLKLYLAAILASAATPFNSICYNKCVTSISRHDCSGRLLSTRTGLIKNHCESMGILLN